MTDKELIKKADTVKENAYVPYSGFPVGAALMSKDGTVFTGCNVENATFGATICAERTAITKAVSEGHKQFSRIAIISEATDYCLPCGICRQVLMEFSPDIELLCAKADGSYESYRLEELLPHAFRL